MIDRPVLQQLLLDRIGSCVTNGVEVVGYETTDDGIAAVLCNGTCHTLGGAFTSALHHMVG